MSKIYFGCDPEFFLRDKKTGKFVSAIGLVGGSKENPKPIGYNCSVQEDNVAVEFNIPPIEVREGTTEEVVVTILDHFNYVYDWVNFAVCEPNGLEIAIVPSAVFEDDQLDNEAAQTFGCDPDYNAYTEQENPRPRAVNPNLRTAGGHVHIGVETPNAYDWRGYIHGLDMMLGLPSILEDADTARRELYGKAGAYRIKEYGVEYRTLSNYWLTDRKALTRIVNTLRIYKSTDLVDLTDEWADAIVEAINTQDIELTKYVRSVFGPHLKELGLW